VISLIIISHCHQIAEGVRELAAQMAGESVPIVAVGGIQEEDGRMQLGTDANRIADAVRSAWSADGVLCLVDLGSAILSAELAFEMLTPEMRTRCLISNAPLVEGAIVAALEASFHRPLEDVNRAAEAASHFEKIAR
jgi:dihydroxyacetone kinase phosphotransfer subunit